MHFYALIITLLFTPLGCQRAPLVSSSADASSVNAPAPMESETSNAELLKRKALLEKILEAKVTKDEFAKAKAFKQEPVPAVEITEIARLSKMIDYLGLDKLPKAAVAGSERDFWTAQFYFYERRFIEAAHIFSKLLDHNPKWLRPRNLLARCFYFLGNTDRSFQELQFVLTNSAGQAEELLDALFLMGAIAMDSPVATPEQLEKGVGAWKTYLRLAPQSPMRQKIQDGLLAFDDKKNTKNAASLSESGNLKADAIAALDGDDLLGAENKIKAALKRFPRDEELAVALARVFVKSGRISESLAAFRRIIEKNPKSVKAHHYQGMAFMMSGDPPKAIASWERVLQLDAGYADKFDLRGRIMIAKNLISKDNP